MRLQEVVLDIEPQEYLLRTVVNIIPVSQLSKHKQLKAQQQQQQQQRPQHQHQTAQQVSAFASPFAQQTQVSTAASDQQGQGSLGRPSRQGSLEWPLRQGSLERPSRQGSLEQPSTQGALERPSRQGSLEQPLLRSPSQIPVTAPSTSDVHLSMIPEHAEAQASAESGPSQTNQSNAQQVLSART